MKSYDINEERKWHDGRVFEVKYENTFFLMRSALRYVVDAIWEGSVELSHHEELNYNEVVDFNKPYFDTTLDLTWMKKDDIFDLRNSEQGLAINEIIANIDNLGYSKIPDKNDHINLKVIALNSKTTFIQQIKAFRYFISHNNLDSITLIGFNGIIENILTACAEKADIPVSSEILIDENQKQR